MFLHPCLEQSADEGGSPLDEGKALKNRDNLSLRLFAAILRLVVAELDAMDISPGFLDAKRHLFVSGALSTLQLLQKPSPSQRDCGRTQPA